LFDTSSIHAYVSALSDNETFSYQKSITFIEGFSDIVRFLDEADESLKELGDTYINGQPIQEAFWRTFLSDRVMQIRPAPDEYEEFIRTLPKFYSKLVSYATGREESIRESPESPGEPPDMPTRKFLEGLNNGWDESNAAMSQWIPDVASLATIRDLATFSPKAAQFYSALQAFDRKFCVTSKGYIGLVPPYTELGDKVCLIYSGTTPCLLRDVGKEKHALVGECYLHGMMNGEILPESGDETLFFVVLIVIQRKIPREHAVVNTFLWLERTDFQFSTGSFCTAKFPFHSILGKIFCLISCYPVWKSRASSATPISA